MTNKDIPNIAFINSYMIFTINRYGGDPMEFIFRIDLGVLCYHIEQQQF